MTDFSVTTYLKDREGYLAEISKTYNTPNSLTLSDKTNIVLALLFGMEHRKFQELSLKIELPELLKACKILDGARYIRQLKRKLQCLRNSKKIKQLKQEIDTHQQFINQFKLPFKASLTSKRINMIKQWAQTIPADVIQTKTFLFGTESWKKLSDLVHFAPSNFQEGWFLSYCFGAPAPHNSLIHILSIINSDNFGEYYQKYKLPYVCLRTVSQKFALNPNDKLLIVNREQLDTILWYWNELSSPQTEVVFATRLCTANSVQKRSLTYGKLLDAILKTSSECLKKVLVNIAQQRLIEYKTEIGTHTIPRPVHILCDASSSMNVAIKTSSIFASLLSVLTDAKMQVFRDRNTTITPPKNVQEALMLVNSIKARSTTSPASSLYYLYVNEIKACSVILVTDEQENTSYRQEKQWNSSSYVDEGFFAQLWKRYTCDVCPEARLIFISFTDSNSDGQMVRSLRAVMGKSYCNENITVHKVDLHNPDLNRLDNILFNMITS